MDSNQILEKEKLNFSGILREASKILTQHPKFISLIIVISLPLFCSSLAHQILLHPTSVELLNLLPHLNSLQPQTILMILCPLDPQGNPTDCSDTHTESSRYLATEKLKATAPRFLASLLLSSAIFNILELLVAITTVHSSAVIYGGNGQMGLREMLFQPLEKVGLRRPLITWLFASLLASLLLLGLISLSINIYFYPISGIIFLALLTKYIEWSAVWNMAIVDSILARNQGYIAIGVAALLSRGRRRIGFCLLLVFFGLKVGLRLPCLYLGRNSWSCGILGNVVFAYVSCVVNVVMWVVFMVYFYDCKKGFLEKKVDMEEGKAAGAQEAVQN